MKGETGTEVGGVLSGDMKGAGADVAGMDGQGGELVRNGDGNTTAARAYVHEGACRSDGFDSPLDEFFGLRAGNEDILVDIEPHAGKPAFVEDVLYGAMGEELAAIDMVLPEKVVGERLFRLCQAIDFLTPGQVFHYPIGDQRCFPAAIDRCQVGRQLSLCLVGIHSVKIDQFT